MSSDKMINWSRRLAGVPLVVLALLVTVGCERDTAQRKTAADDLARAGIDGTWEITFRLERPLSLSTDAKALPRSVTGTLVLLEDHDPPHSFEQIQRPTHIGVYEVDMNSLGFPPHDKDVIPGVAARIMVSAVGSSPAGRRDSVHMVLDPETPRRSVRLSGTFDGTGVSGDWIAESFLGGGGTFTLRRRRENLPRTETQ
jgi:hypothetical protein